MAQEKNHSVRAVRRALEILSAFKKTDQGLSASELLKRVDLTRPTLYRLLATLVEEEFIVSVGEPQRFFLGPAVSRLAQSGPESLNLVSLARPVLARLHETTGETVALFVPVGTLRQCVVELPSPNPLSFKRGVGYKDRIIYGASGRAILAQLLGPLLSTSPRNEAAVTAELQNYAEGSSADISAYPDELCRIRQRGYAVSRNELIHGAVAVASPVFDKLHQVAGSIAVFGPSVRLPADQVKRYGALLVEAGREISAALSQAQ